MSSLYVRHGSWYCSGDSFAYGWDASEAALVSACGGVPYGCLSSGVEEDAAEFALVFEVFSVGVEAAQGLAHAATSSWERRSYRS